jgi:hypothetical protein
VIIPNRKTIKKKIKVGALVLATFFNPLGFDALFAVVMKWTGSYWITDLLFYFISLLFFGLYFLLGSEDKTKNTNKQ